MMKFEMLTILLYIYTCLLVVCLAQDCDAKSWADTVSAAPRDVVTAPTDINVVSKQKQRASPGVHKKLPRNVKKYSVRNVYDGDTLTLVDERRVRLLGIDTPELQEQQAYAPEAKEFTKRHCHKKEIYLDIHGTDKYGRLLAIVWVPLECRNQHDALFLNVNEALVAEGLATVYMANKKERLPNLKSLLALQNTARLQKVRVWRNFVERNVVVTRYGAAYHLPTCRHLVRSHNTEILKASAAIDRGLHACRTCLADEV
jgi:micrococcal nuclease